MTCMLQTLSEITFAALLGEYLLKVKAYLYHDKQPGQLIHPGIPSASYIKGKIPELGRGKGRSMVRTEASRDGLPTSK
jgi:hypothetical protein